MYDISFWPFADKKGIRVLTGTERIKSEIITIMLLQKGENPAIPEIGLAPDIFSTMNSGDVGFFCYQIREEILKRVKDIEELRIYPNPTNNDINSFDINIDFQTKTKQKDSISFVWSQYINFIREAGGSSFLNSLRKNFS